MTVGIRVCQKLIFVLALGAHTGCSEDAIATPVEPAEFTVLSGVETATVIGAEPGVPLTLYNADGEQLITIVTDDLGQAHFAYVPAEHAVIESGEAARLLLVDGNTVAPGSGYMIADESGSPHLQSEAFDVLAVSDIPDPSLYDGQTLTGVSTAVLGGLGPNQVAADGFQYVEMRDGTTLSVMVRFPDPNVYGPGPYPTVVEYSGYSTSKPDNAEPGSFIANLLGYASVGVNMRGTGCSGGVFDVFNPAQHADGYDVVEAIARQEWVLGNRVGMVGLSYSGIAQLYVASTQPPSLAAITPQSTIADSWQMQWPGGIYNSGFTRQWLSQRNDAAEVGGMDWVSERVDGGDIACAENLTLRSQNIDFESFLHGLEFRPLSADGRSLPLLLPKINIPVYHTGAFQDEQTGALFASMFDRYRNTPTKKITMYNGRHPDGYSPLVLTRWFEFLEFYVARRVPRLVPLVRAAAGAEFSAAFGVTGLGFEDDRFLDFDDDDYAGALAAYEAEPTVRVLFENGAGDSEQPGSPIGRFVFKQDTHGRLCLIRGQGTCVVIVVE
ncbi:MAG: CocE/NonD family hydrolase, partial [Nannocystaceae bacterium]|nr:CocE/NonD family hydrolase [Nannocystaceae bacterium]